jgi:hypothetical protein
VPAKGHKQPPEARAKIAASRRGKKHSEATKRAISEAMKISHAIRANARAKERRRYQLRTLGWTEAEIDGQLREEEAGPEGWFRTEAWRASWRARGATDEQIDEVLARDKAEYGE